MPAETVEFRLDDLSAEIREQIYTHVFSSDAVEVGGVLFGTVDAGTGKPVVVGAIEALEAEGARASVTFTHEAWDTIIDVQERDFPDTQIVGWYHSHPGFGIFLSEQDIFIQQHFFAEAHQFALVVDPVDATEGVFGWRDGQIALFDDAPVEGWELAVADAAPASNPSTRILVDLDEDPEPAVESAPAQPIASPEVAVPRRRTNGGDRTVISLDDKPKKKRKWGLMVAAAVFAVAVIGGSVALMEPGQNGDNPTAGDSEKNPHQARVDENAAKRQFAAAQSSAESQINAKAAEKWVAPPPPPPKGGGRGGGAGGTTDTGGSGGTTGGSTDTGGSGGTTGGSTDTGGSGGTTDTGGSGDQTSPGGQSGGSSGGGSGSSGTGQVLGE